MSAIRTRRSARHDKAGIPSPREAGPPYKRSVNRSILRLLRRLVRGRILSAGSIVGGLILWYLVARGIDNSIFLAGPIDTWDALVRLWRSGALQANVWVSAQEFVIGFAAGAVLGIVIGVLMGLSQSTRLVLSPWVSGLYATPIVALAPLLILWLGIGIWSKVVVVLSVVVFPVIINTETGIRQTDPHLIEVAQAFGSRRFAIFRKVMVPSALPFAMAGLRLGIGRGLVGVVVGELFGARAGVGFLLTEAAYSLDTPVLFAMVAILALSGILLTGAFRALERFLLPWKED